MIPQTNTPVEIKTDDEMKDIALEIAKATQEYEAGKLAKDTRAEQERRNDDLRQLKMNIIRRARDINPEVIDAVSRAGGHRRDKNEKTANIINGAVNLFITQVARESKIPVPETGYFDTTRTAHAAV
ncbi:MAG: hypothetical protein EBR02_01690 [Alphaproteobacteria bacterium]|nr:hypothetical protein [Alphaproteobacteria bacterium]